MKMNPKGTPIEYTFANPFNPFVYLLFAPIDWNEELKPCKNMLE